MDVLVVGYGSIGERHATVLTQAGHNVSVVSSRTDVPYPTYKTVNVGLTSVSPHYVVVATGTETHYNVLRELVDNGFREKVLVEKPLFGCAKETFDIFSELEIFVGYNLRFHPVLQHIKRNKERCQAYSANIYVGSYLPRWREQRDYRTVSSSANKSTGGVLRDLSHELDYALWLLGDWRMVNATGGHFSHLDIPADDVFCLMLETEYCPIINIQMNYFDRIGKRELVINYDQETVHADLLRNTIRINNQSEKFENQRNDSYHLMHNEIVESRPKYVCDYISGYRVEQLIAACYQSLQIGGQVRAA